MHDRARGGTAGGSGSGSGSEGHGDPKRAMGRVITSVMVLSKLTMASSIRLPRLHKFVVCGARRDVCGVNTNLLHLP